MKSINNKILLYLIIFAGVFFGFDMLFKSSNYDPTWIFICAAIFGVTFIIHTIIQWLIIPKNTFIIESNISIKAPWFFKNTGRYSFHAKVVTRKIEKGVSSITNEKSIDIQLRKQDHPDLISYFFEMLENAIQAEEQNLIDINPNAKVSIKRFYKNKLLQHKL